MVQYFAENLDGFAVTENGWVTILAWSFVREEQNSPSQTRRTRSLLRCATRSPISRPQASP